MVYLPGHASTPLPTASWKQCGERGVENGDVRETVTGKDSLDSLLPLAWAISQLSGAILGLIPRDGEPVTRVAGTGD